MLIVLLAKGIMVNFPSFPSQKEKHFLNDSATFHAYNLVCCKDAKVVRKALRVNEMQQSLSNII